MLQDNLLPPSQRCSYECEKDPTGPLNRKKLIEHINKQALETPDKPELKPYVPGVIRGKKVSSFIGVSNCRILVCDIRLQTLCSPIRICTVSRENLLC